MLPASPPPRPSYIATVTDAIDLGSGLWGIRVRWHDGTLHEIVVPESAASVTQVVMSINAVMALAKIELGHVIETQGSI